MDPSLVCYIIFALSGGAAFAHTHTLRLLLCSSHTRWKASVERHDTHSVLVLKICQPCKHVQLWGATAVGLSVVVAICLFDIH